MSTLTQENIIYNEMMSHPALFTHAHPQKVAILDNEGTGILEEASKHPHIAEIWHIATKPLPTQTDGRIHLVTQDPCLWLANCDSFDVMIANMQLPTDLLKQCVAALHHDGILVLQSLSPFDVQALRHTHETLQKAGFCDIQSLQFPQPSFPSGWRMAWLATKRSVFRRASEKNIFSKPFKTHYYNFDVHKAALAMPEFMREELIF